MMVDPTSVHPNWDYREFGDMFFVSDEDPLEIENLIDDPQYADQIKLLKEQFEKYKKNTSDVGREELDRKANNN
jgi:hypothetical protein